VTRSKAFTLILAIGVSILLPAGATAQKDPEDIRKVMGLVHILLEQEHISGHKVDDTISKRALKAYLESLDPLKLYFEQSDIDGIIKFETKLDNMLKRGDLEFARLVFSKFLSRLEQRVGQVEELLKIDHDFSATESFTTDPDAVSWSKSEAESLDRWRRRMKYDLLRKKSDKVEITKAKEQINKRFKNFLRRMKQFNDEDILASFVGAITVSYDPHTRYIGAKPFEDMQIHMRLNYKGIGAHLLDVDGDVTITKIIPGGAAAKYGKIKDGDVILEVGEGEDGPLVEVTGQKLSDVVKLIRGEEGTTVRMKIRPKGGGDVVIHKLQRTRVELQDESAIGEVFEHDGTKVGVIDLPSFYRDTDAEAKGENSFRSSTKDVAKYLERFKKEEVDAVILDLRYNGGGLLSEAIELTGLFIDEGPVVQVKDGSDRIQRRNDKVEGMVWEGPLVVLTSRFSASASEILAGAIQDYGRGVVVGDPTTHGKGTVQHVLDLGRLITRRGSPPALGALKITLQKFYRASGDSTQLKGVEPDLVLPSLSSVVEGEADLDFALSFDRIPSLEHEKYGHTSAPVVKKLRDASKQRVDASDAFKRIRTDVARIKKLRGLTEVPLEEKAFMELLADREEGEKVAESAQKDDDAERKINRDDYLNEVLRIATDYARAMKSNA